MYLLIKKKTTNILAKKFLFSKENICGICDNMPKKHFFTERKSDIFVITILFIISVK